MTEEWKLEKKGFGLVFGVDLGIRGSTVAGWTVGTSSDSSESQGHLELIRARLRGSGASVGINHNLGGDFEFGLQKR